MECPRCKQDSSIAADQAAAMGGVLITLPVMASTSLASMILVPYAAPIFLASALYAALRRQRCTRCGHSFTIFQA